MSHDDPFNESVKELKELSVRAKLIQHSVVQRGFIDAANVSELDEVCTEMADLLSLLKEMQRVVEDRGGKVHGRIFSANEIMERQNTLRSLTGDYTEVSEYLRQMKARSKATTASALLSGGTGQREEETSGRPDDFLVTQEYAQREEAKQQDEVIDRLTYGLQELRETGVNINDELVQQDEMLNEMERDLSGVQIRLRAANEKVDKLLASMSNKGKVCTIITLIFILIFLAFFAFN